MSSRSKLAPGTVLLFYDGFERKAIDRSYGRAFSWLRGQARYAYRTLRRRQPFTGYYVAFDNLRRSIEAIGRLVVVNDFALARRHPEHPVGLSGYASVYGKVRLPNPAVFGPGHVPPPSELEEVVRRNNLRIVTLPSSWRCGMYGGLLGAAMQPMFVGIDVAAWPDLSHHPKSLDCLIYDKIRWLRAERERDVLEPLRAMLDRRGLSHRTIRYGGHHVAEFRRLLGEARSLVFVCEHETQGLAYQEAMSSGVPVFAWDEGELVDPEMRRYAPPDIVVSSVPYFDERCGIRFRQADLEERFSAFWQALPAFRPRDYVCEHLGFGTAARRYLELYDAVPHSPAPLEHARRVGAGAL
jgi:hypothetical protein